MLAVLTMIVSALAAPAMRPFHNTTSGGTTRLESIMVTLIPGQFKWGEDSTGGMPYIVPKDAIIPPPTTMASRWISRTLWPS